MQVQMQVQVQVGMGAMHGASFAGRLPHPRYDVRLVCAPVGALHVVHHAVGFQAVQQPPFLEIDGRGQSPIV